MMGSFLSIILVQFFVAGRFIFQVSLTDRIRRVVCGLFLTIEDKDALGEPAELTPNVVLATFNMRVVFHGLNFALEDGDCYLPSLSFAHTLIILHVVVVFCLFRWEMVLE